MKMSMNSYYCRDKIGMKTKR